MFARNRVCIQSQWKLMVHLKIYYCLSKCKNVLERSDLPGEDEKDYENQLRTRIRSRLAKEC